MTLTIENLFQRITEVQPSLDGWCSTDKAITLASIVVACRPEVIVEVGVYGGKSLIPMALACKALNHGIVVGIDPWSNEVAQREQTTQADREWWATQVDLEKIHTTFRAKLKELDLEKWVHIQRKESRNADVPNGISVLHVDGSHAETAFHDVVKFAPRVVVGGFCVTDDSNWTGGGVSRGERRLLEVGFKRIAPLGTGQIFQRIR